jgi:fumarate reductase subunit D
MMQRKAARHARMSGFSWNDVVLLVVNLPAVIYTGYWALFSARPSASGSYPMVVTAAVMLIGVVVTLVFISRGMFSDAVVSMVEFLFRTVILMVVLLAMLFAFTIFYRHYGVCDSGTSTDASSVSASEERHDAATCFYFTTTTWMTIGFGDVTPTPASRKIVVVEAITSYLMTGIFLAVVVRLVTVLQL